MILNIASFLAQAAPAENSPRSMLLTMGPMVIIFVIFYILLIRPQQKQQAELRKMLDALKVGDKVVTTGGIFGTVTHIHEKKITVKIAENTKVEMLRSGIQQVIVDEKDAKKSD